MAFLLRPNGHLVSKLNSNNVKKAMDYQYGLYEDGLVFDRKQFYYAEQAHMMGDGRELFYIGYTGMISCAPDEWRHNIPPKNLGVVPVPSPKGSKPYQAAQPDGYVLCKGAENPEGAARLAECGIIAAYDQNARKLERQRKMNDYGWSSKTAIRIDKINALARKYPVADLAAGCSSDIADCMTLSISKAINGEKWSETRESIADAIEMLVDEVDYCLQEKIKEYK